MIKNVRSGWVLFGLVLGIAACSAKAATDEGYQGVVELDETTLGFDLGGRVASLRVSRGDAVAADQEIAKLDDTLARAAREAREKDVVAARAQVDLVRAGSRREDIASVQAQLRGAQSSEEALKKELERVRALQRSGSLPSAVVDDTEARLQRSTAEKEAIASKLRALVSGARPEELAVAEARASAAQSAVILEDQRLAHHVLHATHKGVVMDVHVKLGEVVSPGAPVVTIADPTAPYVDVFVPEAKIAGLRVGVHGTVRVDSIAHPFQGEIEHISSRTEFTPRYLFSDKERPNLVLRVRVRVHDEAGELHAGVPARVRFEVGR